MDERDSSTLTKTADKAEFLQVTPGLFPNFWVGPGDEARSPLPPMANLLDRIMRLLPCPSGSQLLLVLHVISVREMTSVVDKIACCSCTACPPAIVLRLFIADTMHFATVLANLLKLCCSEMCAPKHISLVTSVP